MHSRLNAQQITSSMDASLDASSDIPLAATLPVGKHRIDRKRAGAIAGVAVASVGVVLPLANEQAVAYEGSRGNTDVAQSASRQQTAELMASAIAPQTSEAVKASFSAQSKGTNFSGVSASKTASSQATSSPVNSLLARAQDGSLRLAYQPPTDASAGQTQTVLTQLVSATKVQSASQSENAGLENGQINQQSAASLVANSGTSSRLLAARQQVQQLQQKMAEFEAARGQQDMGAYRNVLSSRMAEISEQEGKLSANIERNQRLISQLKMRLLTVDADVSLPERVLGADEEYQAVWARLQKAEQDMQEEFSAANVDGTRLNEIYGDYKYHQQWLAKVAEQAFPKYAMADESAQVGFMSKSPVAIDIMQNLVVATHQDQVQQLRQATLDTIDQRLQSRRSQLAADIGQYEQLKRELSTATQVAAEYEQAETQRVSAVRGQLVADRSAAPEASASESEGSAVSQAQLLAPYFANGTLSKTLLGIAIAAGALATAAVQYRGWQQKRLDTDALFGASTPPFAQPVTDFSIAPAAVEPDFSSFSLYGESAAEGGELEDDLLAAVLSAVEPETARPISTDDLMAELLAITRGDEALAAHQTGYAASQALIDTAEASRTEDSRTEASRTEASLLSELSTILKDVNAGDEQRSAPVLTARSIENILGVEVMAKELEDAISVSGPVLAPSRLLPVKTALAEPIKLSVKEIDLFAEQVVRWVLNDLGFQVVNPPNMAS